MAEFKLGRIRFVWRGDWTAARVYYKDDVVRYGGKTYICSIGHTADSDFYTDLNESPTRWNQMTDGQEWKGDWSTATFYSVNDIVKYGGLVYVCNTSHTSAATAADGLELDQAKWDLFIEGFDWKDDWTVNTRYKVGDVVKYGGYVYVANTAHTSAATSTLGLEADQAKWDDFNQGIEYKGDWSGSLVRYKINDVVREGGSLWICTTQHTSTASFIADSATYWSEFVSGIQFDDEWNVSTTYQVGDIVRYGGNQYRAKTNHVGATPTAGVPNWELFSEGFNFESDWVSSTNYQVGDVVKFGGNTYLASQDVTVVEVTVTATSSVTNNLTTSDTSSLVAGQAIRFTGSVFGGVAEDANYYVESIINPTDFRITIAPSGSVFALTTASGSMTAKATYQPPSAPYWSLLNKGLNWQGQWVDDTEYHVGHVVRYGSNAYICILNHRSEGDDGSTIGPEGGGAANSRPDLDTAGTYWNLLVTGNDIDVLTERGDLVYFGGSGPARLPVGGEGQVLRVSANSDPEWVTLGLTDNVYYVGTHGTDLPAPVWGVSQDKPWKTVRYAAEQVLAGPRNPNAKRLLELNRAFIQREIVEWTDYQITNNISPFTSAFDYDEYKCERDMGFIVDAIIHDITHGGNKKSREAALEYVNNASAFYTLGQEAETVASIEYGLTVINSVLSNTDVSTNYQELNGDNSSAIVLQYKDTNYTAESNLGISGLVQIVTDAITAGNANDIPTKIDPQNTIQILTGRFREISPIIVPENTVMLGAEVRSTNVGPSEGVTSIYDSGYSIDALTHLQGVVVDILDGTSVTPTTGNNESQDIAVPFADTVEQDSIRRLVSLMGHNIDFRIGTIHKASYPDPTNYNTSYLIGYGDARKLVFENKIYIKEEVKAYLDEQYPNLKYSRTICKRDVGYIVDAIVYDLTYGGNTQSINAGLAYFDGPGGALAIDSSEKSATLAAYGYLKTMLQNIATNVVNSGYQFTIPQYRDTAGSAAASTLIGENLDIIIDIITNGTDGAPNVTVTDIATNVATTSSAHGLKIGDSFTPRSTANGFVSGTKYWILTVPNPDEFTVSQTFGGSTHTLTNGTGLSITGDVIENPATSWVTAGYVTAVETLDSNQETLVTATTNYITANYPSLTYNSAKCERDTRLILEAIMYDAMFSSNFQTRNAAYAYLRATASEVYSLNQKTATIAAYQNLADTIENDDTYVNAEPTIQSRVVELFDLLNDIIYSGSGAGSNKQTSLRNADHAVLQLERNRDFIVSEIDAYISDTFSDTATATITGVNTITISSTAWLRRNAAIRFTGTTFGGISTGTTYYVAKVVSSTTFTVSTTRNGTEVSLSADTGSMGVALFYDNTACLRDVNRYIDALKYDLKYPGNYKSLLAARYYANSVTGCLEEDFYYVRNGTGVRNQTLQGMTGDLLAPNAYGTSRVSAGAYVSLDPGWGTLDESVWITERSCYVQNVTTFGTAAVGQKIDGALHDGGNDSIVSNDFTQVISDGIGAWVTNNGRAELVSVFTYYSHIGYLSENGGRIRGTNGNNSYGDFGSVAEGFDSRETAGTAVVDNRNFEATADEVFTSGSQILQLYFSNNGNDYTEATWNFFGAGSGIDVLQSDEIRDDGLFQVRLLDLGDDSSGQFGGDGYLTNSNTAQGGTTTNITIAATDGEISTAYVGMKIYLTGGTGAGQYGIINTYNAGNKLATIIKESDGTSGWDHLQQGTTIVAPDASTTYTIEPRISFTAPTTSSAKVDLPATATWTDSVYGNTNNTYTGLTGTYSGSGSGATWNVVRNGSKYILTNSSAGTGYARLETITIDGASLGGTSSTNDLVITITSINSVTGAITAWDYDGYGRGGIYVAVASGGTQAASSLDGETWTSRTLPSSGTWSAVAHGEFVDGSTDLKVGRFVALRSGSNVAAYSENGETWSSTTLPASAAWSSVTFGEGRFVAIASDSTTVAISLDGEVWDLTGTLTATGFNAIAYGKGTFVAVKSGSTVASYSTNGSSWTDVTLPASSAWTSVAFGNNIFVAVASDSNSGAYSTNGTTNWVAMTVGSPDGSTVGGYQKVRYGQGLFAATSFDSGAGDYSFLATSENGLAWDIKGVQGETGSTEGYNALAFGNPQKTGYWVALGYGSVNFGTRVRTGTTTKARAFVAQNKIYGIYINEPGSGYDSDPTMTITDPNNIYELPFSLRRGKGCLANPTYINRGSGYASATAELDTGDGYADFFQTGSFVAVRRLSSRPVEGSNVVFGHLPNRTYKLVNVLTFLGTEDGSYTAFFQVSPNIEIPDSPTHLESITTRIRYSQVRLTGHDFLDIGTGSFVETNYPGTPTQEPNQANETVDNNGGRVFFTSTDQDGNFRVGDLFTIEQSTGIATLNADAFNIAGLQELTLGEVSLGGGSASISEFSTDPFFTADSDSIVPTQRAIKAYISSQIGGGGASLNVNSVTAGSVFINTDQITTVGGTQINMNAKFDFRGGVVGLPIAFNYFLQ